MKRVFRVQLDGEAEQLAGVTCEALEEALASEGCPILFETVTVTEVKAKAAALGAGQGNG